MIEPPLPALRRLPIQVFTKDLLGRRWPEHRRELDLAAPLETKGTKSKRVAIQTFPLAPTLAPVRAVAEGDLRNPYKLGTCSSDRMTPRSVTRSNLELPLRLFDSLPSVPHMQTCTTQASLLMPVSRCFNLH